MRSRKSIHILLCHLFSLYWNRYRHLAKKKKKSQKSRQGLEDSTEEGVLVETASCPVTAGWLCDKTGALTAQGERHVFKRGCLHRQQFGVSGLHGLCFLGLILSKFQIHILIERTKVLLQPVLPVRISLQCAWLLVTWRHRNQGPDSPGNSWCQTSLLYLREYLRQWFPETEYFIDVMKTGKNIGVHCLHLGRATGDLMGFGMFTLVWWCLCKVAASLVLDEDTRGCSQKVFTSTRCRTGSNRAVPGSRISLLFCQYRYNINCNFLCLQRQINHSEMAKTFLISYDF